ncbi:DUF3237 domain-containing protein [Actinomycetospora sp. C-140]
MLESRPLGTLTITVRERLVEDGLPAGRRVLGEVGECVWDGERVRARQQGHAGHDWMTVAPDGTCHVDARMAFRTDDDAVIFMRYGGRARLADGVPVDLVVAPTFETADPRYAWLNTVQAVGLGRRVGFDLVYDLSEVVPPS